jgi:hypothetical protein
VRDIHHQLGDQNPKSLSTIMKILMGSVPSFLLSYGRGRDEGNTAHTTSVRELKMVERWALFSRKELGWFPPRDESPSRRRNEEEAEQESFL